MCPTKKHQLRWIRNFSLLLDSRFSRLFTPLFILDENHCCNISQRLDSVAEAWPIKLTSAELTQKALCLSPLVSSVCPRALAHSIVHHHRDWSIESSSIDAAITVMANRNNGKSLSLGGLYSRSVLRAFARCIINVL